MAKKIKVALITQAAGAHVSAYLSALAATDACGEVALVDPDGAWTGRARQALGARLGGVYTDHRRMLERERPVMVLISLEARLAPPVIDAALDAGCHVFAEKPSCVRAADFAPLAFKADSRHLHLMLALANRLNPEFVAAREMVQAGRFGDIYGVDMHLVADQTRLTRRSYQQAWFTDRERAGGGHLIWLGIHWLDLAMHLTGSDIERVTGMITNIGGQPVRIEDSAVATLKFDAGFLGTMTSGYYLDRGYHSGIRLWGSKGWLQLHQMREQPLSWYENGGQPQQFEGSRQPRGYTPFVRACVQACADDREPPITTQDSLRAIRTVFAIYDSAAQGRAVEL